MKSPFDRIARYTSRKTTRVYSTSFSLGILFLSRKFRDPVYSIYGFVRFADEIVDTFHACDKALLIRKYREDAFLAIDQKISMNPVLHHFQKTVRRYHIERELIDAFLHSMEMDLHKEQYDPAAYEEYILGSAEVVGLMCLHVFLDGDDQLYQELKPYAMRLGAAYQKINFLRDLGADFHQLGRSYFPGVDLSHFTEKEKRLIEAEIAEDFEVGLRGIRKLPRQAGLGVYLSYVYYHALFRRIQKASPEEVLQRRIRVPDAGKYWLMISSLLRFKLNLI